MSKTVVIMKKKAIVKNKAIVSSKIALLELKFTIKE